tara:strand:- start:60 stop:302 length:243 start_codon:yes stop_codon:yes gene_type:complete
VWLVVELIFSCLFFLFIRLFLSDQIHSIQMYHGDIKTENILLTSANWVYLTDFAVFKPTLLPDNDPAGYYYFFENKGETD